MAQVLVYGVGRGNVGKSTELEWMIDRALDAGRDLIIADADVLNRSLGRRFGSDRVMAPKSGTATDIRAMVIRLLEDMLQSGQSAVLDLPGGDRSLEDMATELPLVEFCAEVGVTPVAAMVMGPNIDDLRHLAQTVAATSRMPEASLLVVNAGKARNSTVLTALDPLLGTPEWRAVIKSGAKPLTMPPLGSIDELRERGLSPLQAARRSPAAGDQPVSPVLGFMAKRWDRQMEEAHAKVTEMLP